VTDQIEQVFDAALFAPRTKPEQITAWAKAIDFRKCLAGRRVATPRKPSIRRMIAAAEKAGKTVTSMTMPDGTVLHFGEAPTEASNPWLADLTKVKQ